MRIILEYFGWKINTTKVVNEPTSLLLVTVRSWEVIQFQRLKNSGRIFLSGLYALVCPITVILDLRRKYTEEKFPRFIRSVVCTYYFPSKRWVVEI